MRKLWLCLEIRYEKKFTNMENGQKIQDLLWEIDKETKILAQYKLIDKIWILQKYKIE